MKAAVLGANGYLGKHLALHLLNNSWQVRGYGRTAPADLPQLSFTQLDVRDRDAFGNFDTDVDFVFYFSGNTGAFAYDNYNEFIDVNEKGILHLLDALRRSGSAARVIFPSTRLVYKGIAGVALKEDAQKEFKSIYALNKWFGEQVLEQYANLFNRPFTIFRICVPYGNLFSGSYSYGTIGFFMKKARASEAISLYGNGGQKRTFSHVEDICSQLYDAALNPASVNEIFNIGGETFSLAEAANLVAGRFGTTVTFAAWPETEKKMESGDTIFDAGKLQALTGFTLKHDFRTWLKTVN